ncbi:2-phosphosulfolactate phosphatase [Paenibacillus beijingensis]|uniref:Probable 2-phosphosulfolactate phosphatase n=1 Tax=Paenibacillus beijingensis TaxID=1126833 RepID=A0A0D5NPN7_9BACL|nr:2-phosphosulfolactate phosphatase [Paenibacillus beijingensis]AJY77269.1 2-phosphosulfolactate phosphatase [Paenibacillus beijingensis]
MHVRVISNVNEASSVTFIHRTAVVIDVLRASTTMVAALAMGAESITPVETVLDAKAMRKPGELLGGERFGRSIPGFDLGNSPEEYDRKTVQGKRILFTTTNGTRAVHKALRADFVLVGAFVNAAACAASAVSLKRDAVLLCAGSHDEFALEDGLCAGLLLHRLQEMTGKLETDDFGAAMLGLYESKRERILEMLRQCAGGRKLIKLGHERDVTFCSFSDTIPCVPRLSGDRLVADRQN